MKRYFLVLTLVFLSLQRILSAQEVHHDFCVKDSLTLAASSLGNVLYNGKMLQTASQMIDYDADQAFGIIYKVFVKAVTERDLTLKADAYMALATCFVRQRHFLNGLQFYMSAVNNYRELKDSVNEIRAFVQIGNVNNLLDHSREAIDYLGQAYELSGKYRNLLWQGISSDYIGRVFQGMDKFDSAEIFYNRAIRCFESVNNRQYILMANNNKVSLLMCRGKYDEALQYYFELLRGRAVIDDQTGTIYTRIGHCYDRKKDYRTSLNYDKRALEIRQMFQDKCSIISSLINVAGDYFNLDMPDSANYFLNPGMEGARKYNYLNFLINGYSHQYLYYQRRHDFRQALHYHALYGAVLEQQKIDQNKTDIEILKKNQELQKRMETGRQLMQQADIQALILTNQRYPFYFVLVLVSMAGITLIVVLVIYLINRNARQKKQVVNEKLTAEIKERELKDHKTHQTEGKFRFLSENSIDFITVLNDEMQRIYASPACQKLFGYTPLEMLQIAPAELAYPAYLTGKSVLHEIHQNREIKLLEHMASKKDGTTFWVESMINPLFDEITGDYKGIVAVIRDIQQRKTKELEIMEGTRQKENLLKEIHHRVKNNFAILVSLINMQMNQIRDKELIKSLTNLQLRIRSMALVHEMLYRSNDFENISFREYLKSLASVVSGTFARRDVELSIEAEDAVLNIDASIPLGLIVNELLSNCYMHAFPDGRTGSIVIEFSCLPGNQTYRLIIGDNGIGLPPEISMDRIETMGLQIVNLLCTQLDAELVISKESGTKFSITFRIQDS